jgi:predicted RNase H-like nuclease (RuvC/YqgF family)
MAKLLKPLVVILLLLAIAAVCIQAFVLFPKRTLIKDRTLKLQDGIGRVVANLKGPQSLLSDEAKQAAQFNAANLQIATPEEFPRLDGELARANSVASAVLQGWNDTQTDLENTRQDLENTRAELEATKAQLEDARTQIVQLNETIRAKDAELAEKSNRIAQLEDEKTSLESQLATLNEEIDGMRDQLAQLEEEKNMLDILLKKCEGERAETLTMPAGTAGKIVYANADWNFVVIDVGSTAGAQVTAEMIVHRDDNMIGKIRISAIRENVSIAEVLTDFQKDAIKEGDHVLY